MSQKKRATNTAATTSGDTPHDDAVDAEPQADQAIITPTMMGEFTSLLQRQHDDGRKEREEKNKKDEEQKLIFHQEKLRVAAEAAAAATRSADAMTALVQASAVQHNADRERADRDRARADEDRVRRQGDREVADKRMAMQKVVDYQPTMDAFAKLAAQMSAVARPSAAAVHRVVASVVASVRTAGLSSVEQKAQFVVALLSGDGVPVGVRVAVQEVVHRATHFFEADSPAVNARLANFVRTLLGVSLTAADVVVVSKQVQLAAWWPAADLPELVAELQLVSSAAAVAAAHESLASLRAADAAAAAGAGVPAAQFAAVERAVEAACRRTSDTALASELSVSVARHVTLTKPGGAALVAALKAAAQAIDPVAAVMATLQDVQFATVQLNNSTVSSYLGLLSGAATGAGDLAPVGMLVLLGDDGAVPLQAIADTGAPYGVVDSAALRALPNHVKRPAAASRVFEMADGTRTKRGTAVELLLKPEFAAHGTPAQWVHFHVLNLGAAVEPAVLIMGVSQLAACGGAAISITADGASSVAALSGAPRATDGAATNGGAMTAHAAGVRCEERAHGSPLQNGHRRSEQSVLLLLVPAGAQEAAVADGACCIDVELGNGAVQLVGGDDMFQLLADTRRMTELMAQCNSAMAADGEARGDVTFIGSLLAPDLDDDDPDNDVTVSRMPGDKADGAFEFASGRAVFEAYVDGLPMLEQRHRDKLKARFQCPWSSKRAPKPPKPYAPVKQFVHTIKLKPAAKLERVTVRGRHYSPAQREVIYEQGVEWLRDGTIEPVTHAVYSVNQIVTAPKFDGDHQQSGWRVCLDLRFVNEVSELEQYVMPFMMDEVATAAGGRGRISVTDMAAWFLQFELDPASRDLTTTAFGALGLARFTRMPFGLKSAPATGQRVLDVVFRHKSGGRVAAYIDDAALVHRAPIDDMDEAVEELCVFIADPATEYGVVLNADKLQWFAVEVKFLGCVVRAGSFEAPTARVDTLLAMERPDKNAALQRFLQMGQGYSRHMPRWHLHAAVLWSAMERGRQLVWSPDAAAAWVGVRESLATALACHVPLPGVRFTLGGDASLVAISGTVWQKLPDGRRVYIRAWGRKKRDYETRYSVMDSELLAIVETARAEQALLAGRAFDAESDSKTLVDTMTHSTPFTEPARNLPRQSLITALAHFEIVWRHVPGKDNELADVLSRMFASRGPEPRLAAAVSASVFEPATTARQAAVAAQPIAVLVSIGSDTSSSSSSSSSSSNSSGGSSSDSGSGVVGSSSSSSSHGSSSGTLAGSNSVGGSASSVPPLIAPSAAADTGAVDKPGETEADIDATHESATVGVGALLPQEQARKALGSSAGAEAASAAADERAVADGARGAVDDAYSASAAPPGSELHDMRRVVEGANRLYARLQKSDPKLKWLMAEASGATLESHRPKHAVERQPFVDGTGRLFTRDPTTGGARLAVHQADVERVVLAHHNGIPGGHRGAATTFERLCRTYWWPGMRADVERVVERCRVCNATAPARAATELGTYPQPGRLEVVHMDTKPMPKAATGETAALILVDAATGFLSASPLASQRGDAIAAALEQDWFNRYGPPRVLKPDNQGSLVGSAVKEKCAAYGVELAPVAPHNPAANGLAEAGVKVWSRTMRKLLVGRPISSWPALTQAAVMSYNTAMSQPRGHSPFQLMYGTEAHTPAQRADGVHQDEPGPAHERAAVVHAVTVAMQKDADAKRLARHDGDVSAKLEREGSAPVFRVGEVVWLRNVAALEGSKFANMLTHNGPFFVVRADPTGNQRFQLAVCATRRVVQWRGVGRNAQDPRWFAARLLSHVPQPTTLAQPQPTGGAPLAFAWSGANERELLPTPERIEQARLDQRAVNDNDQVVEEPEAAAVPESGAQQERGTAAVAAAVAVADAEQGARNNTVGVHTDALGVEPHAAPAHDVERAALASTAVAAGAHVTVKHDDHVAATVPTDDFQHAVEVLGTRFVGGSTKVVVRFKDSDPHEGTIELEGDEFPDLMVIARQQKADQRARRHR